MRQAQIDEFGGPEVLHAVDVADPTPGDGQVLVAVDAAGITFVETQMRSGTFSPPGAPPIAFPAVLGNGVEGRVVAVGPSVDASLIGEAVVTATGGLGGYRSMVVVDAAATIPVPAGLEVGQAVAMLADGRTALAQARAAELAAGDRVLVLAAAGGVGSLLVQLAVEAGATVVAAAGGAAKAEVAADLGAQHTVDYSDRNWPDAGREAVGLVDVVFDGVGGALGRAAIDLLAEGGRRVAYGMASGVWASVDPDDRRGIAERRGVIDGPADNRALVEQALALVADGSLRPVIGQTFALDDAAAAHRAIESRTTVGKTVLLPRRGP